MRLSTAARYLFRRLARCLSGSLRLLFTIYSRRYRYAFWCHFAFDEMPDMTHRESMMGASPRRAKKSIWRRSNIRFAWRLNTVCTDAFGRRAARYRLVTPGHGEFPRRLRALLYLN